MYGLSWEKNKDQDWEVMPTMGSNNSSRTRLLRKVIPSFFSDIYDLCGKKSLGGVLAIYVQNENDKNK